MIEPLPMQEPWGPQLAQGEHEGPQNPGRQALQVGASGPKPGLQASHSSPV